jgi:chitinase
LPSSSTSSYPASPSSSTSSSSSSYSYGYGNSSTGSSSPSSTHSLSYTTETITTTTIRTISSCAPTVTNCPYGKVLTDTIEITTTYCPGNQSPTSSAAVTTSAPAQTTLTIYTTTVYTVTSCAPTVTNCPAKVGQVTTETIVDYTTVCPVAEASSLASSLGLITAPAAPSTSTSTATSSLTIVKLVTETVKPVAYTPVSYTPSSNYTVAASGSAVTLSSYPSTSPVSYKGAASGLQTGSGLAMFIIVAAAALFL